MLMDIVLSNFNKDIALESKPIDLFDVIAVSKLSVQLSKTAKIKVCLPNKKIPNPPTTSDIDKGFKNIYPKSQ